MTSVPRPADPAQTFVATYDAWNRLVKLTDGTNTVAEYVYDGMNRRAVKRTYTAGTLSETRHYYYSQGWQILEERVGSGSPSSLNPDRQYLWGLQYVDQLICRWRRLTTGINDEVLYAVQDANWNVTGIWGQVSGAWQLRQRQSYDPYGQVTYLNPTTFVPTTDAFDWETLYAGYRFDKESRMYQVRNRYYNTAIGTWVSRDPVGERALQGNVLAYSNGDPAGSVDPFGLYTAKTTITGDMKGEFQRNRYFGKGPPPDLRVSNTIEWYPPRSLQDPNQQNCECHKVDLYRIVRTRIELTWSLNLYNIAAAINTSFGMWHWDNPGPGDSSPWIAGFTQRPGSPRPGPVKINAWMNDQPGFNLYAAQLSAASFGTQEFEVCAVCTGSPSDRLYDNILGCARFVFLYDFKTLGVFMVGQGPWQGHLRPSEPPVLGVGPSATFIAMWSALNEFSYDPGVGGF